MTCITISRKEICLRLLVFSESKRLEMKLLFIHVNRFYLIYILQYLFADGPATINVNIYLRTISRIDDVKMVSVILNIISLD